MIILLTALASAAPLAVGAVVEQTLHSIRGEPVTLPDPDGRTVVVELIRSPEW